MRFNVAAHTQIHRLEERAARRCIQVAHLDDIADRRNILIRRNRHVPDRLPIAAVAQTHTHTALTVGLHHHRAECGNKLELQLRATAAGATRRIGSVASAVRAFHGTCGATASRNAAPNPTFGNGNCTPSPAGHHHDVDSPACAWAARLGGDGFCDVPQRARLPSIW